MNYKSAVVFLGMTYPHGIIRHFALLAVELNKVLFCKYGWRDKSECLADDSR